MKKFLSIIGMITGIFLIIVGILSLTEVLGDAGAYGGDNHIGYDNGYTYFGADYYTYSVNNAARAVDEIDSVNTNLRSISDFLQRGIGLFLIGIGILAFCGFGIVFAGCERTSTTISVPETLPNLYKKAIASLKPQVPQSNSALDTWYCTECGLENDKDNIFCTDCGTHK